MKNLFKNLMLVAVAAMAFTACTETNDEVNAVSKKTVLNGVVGFAEETRSGFSEETSTNDEGKTVYHSEWDGNESILVVCNGQAKTAPITKNDEGNANFTVEFDGELGDLYYVSVYSPASAFDQSGICTIPSEQTPRANSVDPAAHALSVSSTPVSAGSAYFAMQHSAAYGKMTVKGVDFKIDHVVVDLKGSYYSNARELSYTINADNVENNTFWFATEPIDVAKFTVTAYDAEGNSVTKTVDVAADDKKTLSFQYGRVGTFSVSGLEKYVEKFDSTYAYVYQDYGATDKEIMFVAEDGRGLRIDFYNVYENNCIVSGTYTFTGDSKMYPNWCYYYANVANDYISKLTDGQAVVSVEDGQYKIVFTNMAYNGTVYVEQFTFKGQITGLQVPDARTPLATPNVTATAKGNIITLSWEAVTGAKEYYVFCSSTGSISPITTTETTVNIEAAYSTEYEFMVTAKADDSDPDYKSSEAKTIKVSTEKDPNKWVDVVATNIQWDNSNSCFTLTAPGFDYINLEVNSANRPNNNSLVVGDYTYGQSENQFRIKYNNGTVWSYSDSKGSTMNVSFADGEYTIIINVTSGWGTAFKGSIGYKGMPEGWVAPGEGGDEPVNPEPVPLATPTASATDITANSITVSWNAVANASNYAVTINGSAPQTISDTSYTFTDLEAETDYVITVVAKGNDAEYLDSVAATVNATTLAAQTGGGEPDQPDDDSVVFSSCTYLENIYGMLKHYKFVSADGNNIVHVFMNSNNSGTATTYIPVGDYTNDTMNSTATNASKFNMDCNMGVSITDTKINGVTYANGISKDASNTMSVKEASNGGNHVIEFNIKGVKFRFSGTIQ